MTIPKLIHQTFEHKNFSSDLQEIVDEWSIENPLFSHKVYDNEECNKNPNRIDWGKCNKFEDVIDTRYPPLYPSFRS